MHRTIAIIATLLAALLWSTGGLFIKLLPQDAMTILFYRSFYAALIYLLIFRKSLFKYNKLSMVSCLFYAPLLIAFVSSTKLTTAANAIFLQYTAPAFVLILEPYLSKTKIKNINIVTVAVCFIGMAMFFIDQFTKPDNWLGIWLGLVSGLGLAGLVVTQKLNKPEFHSSAVFMGNLLVCLVTLPWYLKSPFPSMVENLYLMILGFGQLGLGYILFFYGQKFLPAIESSLIAMLEPILNPVWVFIGYGENPGVWAIIGGSIIISSLSFRLWWIEVKEKIHMRSSSNKTI